MDGHRYVVQTPVVDLPLPMLVAVTGLMIVCHIVKTMVTSLWTATLLYIVVLLGGAMIFALLYHVLLSGDTVLTEAGIHRERRLKTPDVSWDHICQVTAIDYGNTKLLVLLKSGGREMSEGGSKIWFFLRNSGKTVLLPDDRYTRKAVIEFYGPVDLELSCEG